MFIIIIIIIIIIIAGFRRSKTFQRSQHEHQTSIYQISLSVHLEL